MADRPVLGRVGSKFIPAGLSQALDGPGSDLADLVEALVYEAVGLGFQVL